jgi:hypothetical protein
MITGFIKYCALHLSLWSDPPQSTSLDVPDMAGTSRRVRLGGVETQSAVVSNPEPAKARLTGKQKWLIAALLLLQVPASLIFYPLAAIISLTGIGVPLSMILLGIGTLPFSSAMKLRGARRPD